MLCHLVDLIRGPNVTLRKPPATEKRSATEKPPVTPPAAGAVLPCFQRLQATGIDHFKVDVGNRKSFTLKAPNGDQGSSVGVILTGNGSFYVLQGHWDQWPGETQGWTMMPLTFMSMVSSCRFPCHFWFSTLHSGTVQVNAKGGLTVPWGKPDGDDGKDCSTLTQAWEKATKVANWPWYISRNAMCSNPILWHSVG